MSNQEVQTVIKSFNSGLSTLEHLITCAENHFGDKIKNILLERITTDMFPLGTQFAFICNQPRNFASWCLKEKNENLNADVRSQSQIRDYISVTRELLGSVGILDSKLLDIHRIDLDGVNYLELSGRRSVYEFWMPNFYFHLTTAYNILRMQGAPIGKKDFMVSLAPLVRQRAGKE